MTLTRRAVLTGVGGAGLLAACTAHPVPAAPAVPDPDTALRAAAVDRERALVQAYDAALAQPVTAATPVLATLRAEHVVHLSALGAPPPAPAPSSSPTAAPAPPSRAALVAAERDAAAAHALATVTASAPLAAVLAQLCASEASHDVALR